MVEEHTETRREEIMELVIKLENQEDKETLLSLIDDAVEDGEFKGVIQVYTRSEAVVSQGDDSILKLKEEVSGMLKNIGGMR